jgi:hypothetical protein
MIEDPTHVGTILAKADAPPPPTPASTQVTLREGAPPPSPIGAVARAERDPKTTLAALLTVVATQGAALVPLVTHFQAVVKIIGPHFGAVIIGLGAISIAATCVASAGASILKLFPRNAEHDVGAEPSLVADEVGKESSTMSGISLSPLQVLGVAGLVLGDIETYAAGAPVSGKTDVFGEEVDASVIKLTGEPTPDWTVFTGAAPQLIGLGFSVGMQVASGIPVKIAAKIGNTWSGITLSMKKAGT